MSTPAPHLASSLDTTPAVHSLLARLAALVAPPERLSTTDWARTYRRLSPKATARPGVYNPDLTPWVKHIHDALDDPAVTEIICMKSAQVAWTDGVLLNYLGRRIDIDPAPMIVMFAKEQAAKEFNAEKFEPMCEATPRLGSKIPVSKSRDKDNRWAFKGFPGGFLKFVGSNSPSSVKSTPAPVVAVEEPDDCNENVKDQGDTITLLRERTKTFARRKVIFGGTPTIKGLSRIESAYLASDQRRFEVPCHDCGEHQALSWEHVHWDSDPTAPAHEVFGHALPETARYTCQHCGSLWTDAEKNRAVRSLRVTAGAAFRGVAGFAINELYSPFPGSIMARLVEKYLAAEHALAQGDDTKSRSFRNNSEGLPYEYKSELPEAADLSLRAESYAEFTVPQGGLLLTMGVDVQHDRLAVCIRAWGRGEESWLVYWGELFGSTLNPADGAWVDLDKLIERSYLHASGAGLRVAAVSIDGSDGNRTEIVAAYVRRWRGRAVKVMLVKGASEQGDDRREIYATPRRPDLNRKNKPMRASIEHHIVGTTRAKDLLLETRLKLSGAGPGRLHWYAGVRPDYWQQLTSEVKAPSRLNRLKKTWQKKGGVRNEGLDTEVYALHAARSQKTNLMGETHWAQLEGRMLQLGLLDADPIAPDTSPAAAPEPGLPPPLATVAAPPPTAPIAATITATITAPLAAPAAPPTPAPAARRKAPRSRSGFATNW